MSAEVWGYVATIVGSSAFTAVAQALINKRKNKAQGKSAEIEATESSFEALQLQVEHLKKSLEGAYETTRKMQGVIDRFRETNIQLTKELANAQMLLAKNEVKVKACEECPEKSR